MQIIARCAVFLIFLLPPAAVAQSDGCRGALDVLNRVKEQITPKLSAATPSGRSRLQVMHSALDNGTHVCKDVPELWYYLMYVSQSLGLPKDYAYAKQKVSDLNYDNQVDPFALPPAAESPSPSPVPNIADASGNRKKWALVVGIDKFVDDRVPGLDYAVKDSKDFVRFLNDPKGGRFDPSHVFYLENEGASLQGIRMALGKLRVVAKPDDLIVLYLSSHGSPRDRDPNGVSFIVTHDTNLEDAATLYASSLQMIDLVQLINWELKARHVVLILDTCYSGGVLETPQDAGEAAPFSQAFNNLKFGRGRAVLTASRSNERSWESKDLDNGGNGYFMHYLLQVLREGGANQNLDRLFSQVQARVAAHVKADLNAQQTPSFQFSEQASAIVLDAPESGGK